jgi:amidase
MITPFPRTPSWQNTASKKRLQTFEKIPTEWILSPATLESAKHQSNIAGEFLDDLLDIDSRQITNMDGVDIANSTSNGRLTAVQVVTAFAKRTSYAHQLVR